MKNKKFSALIDQELELKIDDLYENKNFKKTQILRQEALDTSHRLILHPEVAEYIKKKIDSLVYWFDWKKCYLYYYYDPEGLDHCFVHDTRHGVSICTTSLLHSGLYFIDDNCHYRRWAWDTKVLFECSGYREGLWFPIHHRNARHKPDKFKLESKNTAYFSPISQLPVFPWVEVVRPYPSNKLYYSLRWAKTLDILRKKISGLSDIKINCGKLYTTIRIDTMRDGRFLQQAISSKIKTLYPCKFTIRLQSLIHLARNIIRITKKEIKKGYADASTLGELDVIPLRLSSKKGWAYTAPIGDMMLFMACRNYKTKHVKTFQNEDEIKVRRPMNFTISRLKMSSEYIERTIEANKKEIFINV